MLVDKDKKAICAKRSKQVKSSSPCHYAMVGACNHCTCYVVHTTANDDAQQRLAPSTDQYAVCFGGIFCIRSSAQRHHYYNKQPW